MHWQSWTATAVSEAAMTRNHVTPVKWRSAFEFLVSTALMQMNRRQNTIFVR